MSNDPLDVGQFNDFVNSISRGLMHTRDQHAKLKAMAAHHTITCAQLVDIINVAKTIQQDLIVVAYPALSDPAEFETVVLGALKWKEDRDEVKKKLGLE